MRWSMKWYFGNWIPGFLALQKGKELRSIPQNRISSGCARCILVCRGELGRFPLSITINQKILKYILYIQSEDEESRQTSLLMPFDLVHCNGKNSFRSHLMNMSEYFKLPDFNPTLLDIAMVKSYVSSMKQEHISYWQNMHPSTFSKTWIL